MLGPTSRQLIRENALVYCAQDPTTGKFCGKTSPGFWQAGFDHAMALANNTEGVKALEDDGPVAVKLYLSR